MRRETHDTDTEILRGGLDFQFHGVTYPRLGWVGGGEAGPGAPYLPTYLPYFFTHKSCGLHTTSYSCVGSACCNLSSSRLWVEGRGGEGRFHREMHQPRPAQPSTCRKGSLARRVHRLMVRLNGDSRNDRNRDQHLSRRRVTFFQA